jgi:hypothetical protein
MKTEIEKIPLFNSIHQAQIQINLYLSIIKSRVQIKNGDIDNFKLDPSMGYTIKIKIQDRYFCKTPR